MAGLVWRVSRLDVRRPRGAWYADQRVSVAVSLCESAGGGGERDGARRAAAGGPRDIWEFLHSVLRAYRHEEVYGVVVGEAVRLQAVSWCSAVLPRQLYVQR